jgi:hypothetical protein
MGKFCPQCSAAACAGRVKIGLDRHKWQSKPCNGSYRWFRVSSTSKSRPTKSKRTTTKVKPMKARLKPKVTPTQAKARLDTIKEDQTEHSESAEWEIEGKYQNCVKQADENLEKCKRGAYEKEFERYQNNKADAFGVDSAFSRSSERCHNNRDKHLERCERLSQMKMTLDSFPDENERKYVRIRKNVFPART